MVNVFAVGLMASPKCILGLAAPETGHSSIDSSNINSADTPQRQTEKEREGSLWEMGKGRAGSPQSASKDLSIDWANQINAFVNTDVVT